MLRQAYLAKVRSKREGPKYQFGIRVPCNYKEALEIDRLNGNTLWQDACKTEVDQINEYKTFIPKKDLKRPPKGYQFIKLHFVLQLNMI